jgi:hypothetical protein
MKYTGWCQNDFNDRGWPRRRVVQADAGGPEEQRDAARRSHAEVYLLDLSQSKHHIT